MFGSRDLFILPKNQSYRERERQRKRSSLLWFTPKMEAMTRFMTAKFGSRELLSHFSCGFRGPRALRHPLLPSQAHQRELDQKWSSEDSKQNTYGMLVLQAENQLANALHWP